MYPFQYNNDNTIVSSRLQQLFGDYDVRVTRSNFLFVLNFETNWNSWFSSVFVLTGQFTKLIGNMFSMFNPMSAMTSKCNLNIDNILLNAYYKPNQMKIRVIRPVIMRLKSCKKLWYLMEYFKTLAKWLCW